MAIYPGMIGSSNPMDWERVLRCCMCRRNIPPGEAVTVEVADGEPKWLCQDCADELAAAQLCPDCFSKVAEA